MILNLKGWIKMKDILDKILFEMLKDDDFKKEIEKKMGNHNCKIVIEQKGAKLSSKASGSAFDILIALKTVLNTFQKKHNISDDDLDELMSAVISITVDDD